jgi:cilia- and flagella-associated protein 298
MRIKLDIFACCIEDLATHGPLKPDEIKGLNDQELIDNALIIAPPERKQWGVPRKPQGDERYNEDKTHYRIGIIKNEQLTKMMIETSNKAKKLVSYKMVDQKLILTLGSILYSNSVMK